MKGVALGLSGGALAGGLALLSGCPSTTPATLYTPVTGIEIDSDELTQGIGCGTQPGQLYKYAAVVYATALDAGQPSGSGLPVSGVFDCFATGQFSNLPSADGGNVQYAAAIYAWDEQTFPAALAPCVDLATDGAPPACPGEVPANVLKYASSATWKTTCIAMEDQGVTGVAVCKPLVASDAGSPGTDDAAPFVADAGDAATGDATVPSDAGSRSLVVETQAFAQGDGGALRCGTDYDSVSASYEGMGQIGSTSALPCPSPLGIPVAPAVTYDVAARLIRGDAAVGQSACVGTVDADASSATATCGPVGASADL